ncbi:MAG TPA: TniB family NTP-binding protein [Acidobacteriaceae bacterium]|nr:TniB family NTP-binding protein [Acidobacteriaceae bacterium]
MSNNSRTIVEEILIPHSAFEKAAARIEQCFLFAEGKGETEGMAILGESGTGKTTVLKNFYAKHHFRHDENGREVPVLFVSTPSAPTPKGLAGVMLTELGAADAEQGTENYRTNRLKRLMKETKTRMVIIDEFQQFYDRGKRKVMHHAADWLKGLIDQTRTTLVIAGLPTAMTVIDSNEQLTRRFLAPIELPRFSWTLERQRIELQDILNAFYEAIASEFDLPNLASDEMAFRLYCATGGLMGYLSKLLKQTLRNASIDKRRIITLEDFNIAHTEAIWSSQRIAGLPLPFASDFTPSETVDLLDAVGKIGTVQTSQEPARRPQTRKREQSVNELLKVR